MNVNIVRKKEMLKFKSYYFFFLLEGNFDERIRFRYSFFFFIEYIV